MIITEKKSFSKILSMLENIEKVFIVGCGDCATLCSTGGETEVEDMHLKLEKNGKIVTGSVIPKTPCHVQLVRREMRICKSEVNEAEAILVLACGSGIQSVSEVLPRKLVFPGLDTLFLGNIKRYGFFDERCSMCGDCILDKTMGICPVTRCAKGLVNGPCGGSVNGKCEVFEDRDCVWALIFEKFKKFGCLDLLKKYQPMKDFEVAIKPAVVDIRKETQDERANKKQEFKQKKIDARRKFKSSCSKLNFQYEKDKNGFNRPVSKLQKKLQDNDFVFTCEIIPPKGIYVDEALNHALALRDYITAFSLNENPGSIMRAGSLSMSALFAKEGLEPILHLTTRERNRLALQSEMLGANILGIHNILAMTGDHQSVGDHKEAKPVYDVDSVQLIAMARNLTQGRDYNGNSLEGAPKFLLGGVVSPESDILPMELIKLKKKVDAGASFFITQAIFDGEVMKRFMEEVSKFSKRPKIIAGVIPLKSRKMAEFMNNCIPGIKVPEKIMEKFDNVKDVKSLSIELVRNLVQECRPYVDGIHFMPIGWYDLIPEIVK